MTSRLLISLSLLLLAWQKVCAQLAPAEDFFDRGAQYYISNNIPAALEQTEMGLKTYPDDEKLKKLEQLLKQQQQQQNQQNQQQQQDKKDQQQNKNQKQDQQQQNQQNQQQKNSDQQKRDQQKQNQSNPKKNEEQKQESGDGQKGEKQEQQPGQPVKAGEMTPEDAKRLLDAQKGSEQLLQMQPQEKPRDPNRPVRDW